MLSEPTDWPGYDYRSLKHQTVDKPEQLNYTALVPRTPRPKQ